MKWKDSLEERKLGVPNRPVPTFDYQPGWWVCRTSRVDEKYWVLASIWLNDIENFQWVELLFINLQETIWGLQWLPIFEPIETRLWVPCEKPIQTQRVNYHHWFENVCNQADPCGRWVLKLCPWMLFWRITRSELAENSWNCIYLWKFFPISSVASTPYIFLHIQPPSRLGKLPLYLPCNAHKAKSWSRQWSKAVKRGPMSLDFITVSVPVSKTQKQKQFSSFLQAEIRKKRKKKINQENFHLSLLWRGYTTGMLLQLLSCSGDSFRVSLGLFCSLKRINDALTVSFTPYCSSMNNVLREFTVLNFWECVPVALQAKAHNDA